MLLELKAFSSWFLKQQPSNIIYCYVLFLILILFVILCVIAFRLAISWRSSRSEADARENENSKGGGAPITRRKAMYVLFIDILAMIIDLATLLSVPVKELISNYDVAVMSCYEDAERLYNEYNYQKAKGFYKQISITNFKECREKILWCDYHSSAFYVSKHDYDAALKILLPHLSDISRKDDSEVFDKMRELLEASIKDVEAVNQSNHRLVDEEWMLGKWSDESDNYISFFQNNDGRVSVEQNLHNLLKKENFCYMRNGVYSVWKEGADAPVTIMLFYAISENESHVYDLLSGNIYFLVRNGK